MTHAGLLYFLQADIKRMIDGLYDQMLFFFKERSYFNFHEFTFFSRKPTSVLKHLYKKAMKL